MDKDGILSRHEKSHNEFASFILDLNEVDFGYRHHNEKWSAGEQLEHINKTVGYLARALRVPKFVLKYKFGKSNRPSKSFDELVAKYTKGIQGGFKAQPPFIPTVVEYQNRQSIANNILKNARRIERKIQKFSEANLDIYIVPHPALGILTMREMMYFTIHHVEDHLHQTKRNLEAFEPGLLA